MSISGDEMRSRMERALHRGGDTHTLADVAEMVESKQAQFWTNGDGAIVTEIHTFPRRRAIHYWLVAGDLRDCLALEHHINPWAIERGCSIATAVGRRGWLGPAGKTGWRAASTLNLWKPLTLEGRM